MESGTQHELSVYNEALILPELERRFYLYLVGGEYEQLFYSFDSVVSNHNEDTGLLGMTRIKLDVEVSQAARRNQSAKHAADRDYKQVLDFMLHKRINKRLEQQDDLLRSCPYIHDLLPILQEYGRPPGVAHQTISAVELVPWLREQVLTFCATSRYQKLFNIQQPKDIQHCLDTLGESLFAWLTPHFCAEALSRELHPSLVPVLRRLGLFGQFISGAIAGISLEQHVSTDNALKLYSLAGINGIPMTLLLFVINEELVKLLAQQRRALSGDDTDADKRAVLDNYSLSGDMLRDILVSEELIKPHVLESIGFTHFDPMPYLLGYADENAPMAQVFFQARAYALYRQLFKTGRIHPHETAVFLKKYAIDKNLLKRLNQLELSELNSHLKLHQRLQAA